MDFKINDKIFKLLIQQQQIIDDLVSAVCEEESLSKIDRLILLEAYDLFTVSRHLTSPVRNKYEDQLKKISIDNGASYFIVDAWPFINVDHYNRGQLISFSTQLEIEKENNNGDASAEITVLRDRSTGCEIKITLAQLESDVYDYCVSNKIYGSYFDW